jgi:methylmalonyl-CoA decarboxylase subunit alpha
MKSTELDSLTQHVLAGGQQKYHDKNASQGKLFARERIRRLLDAGSFTEDGLFANAAAEELPADGVVTGLGRVLGRHVAVMANDSTVKAGSWGQRTVEKIIRIQENAEHLELPLFYLVDSAGARITDQVELFPGRRGAGRIFYNQVGLSGAYIPAFCDVVVMVDGNASMYLGWPRMAEMVAGEKATFEEMGGAKMHTSVSGCADALVESEDDAIDFAKRYFSFMPASAAYLPPRSPTSGPSETAPSIEQIVIPDESKPFDMFGVIDILKLASNLVVDAVLPFERLREEIVQRLSTSDPEPSRRHQRKHLISPM